MESAVRELHTKNYWAFLFALGLAVTYTHAARAFLDPSIGLREIAVEPSCLSAEAHWTYYAKRDQQGTDKWGPTVAVINNCKTDAVIEGIEILSSARDVIGPAKDIQFVTKNSRRHMEFNSAGGEDCRSNSIAEEKNATLICRRISITPGELAAFNFFYEDLFIITGQVDDQKIAIKGRLKDNFRSPEKTAPSPEKDNHGSK